MQNVAVPIMVLQTALLPPESSLAMIVPVAAAVMTMMPLYIITPAYMFYQWWTTKVCHPAYPSTHRIFWIP